MNISSEEQKMNKEMYDKLNETESYHWWFKAKRKIVLELAKPYLNDTREGEISLADMGCGTGLLLYELEKIGNVTGYDYSDTALAYCKRKNHAKLVKFNLGDSAFEPQATYDMVFALDILEHIKNDTVAINNIYKAVKNGGHAVITTPAFQWLWSQNDINNMHYRRYSLQQLTVLAENAGFNVEFISYYNFWLFVPIAIIKWICRVLHLDKHSSIEYNSGNGLLNNFLYKIFSAEGKRISVHKSFPFGVSLIMLCSKNNRINIHLKDNENKYWDKIAEEYADEIMKIQPTFFENSAKMINMELKPDLIVADIGNGGVINYQYTDLKKLDCIDLSTSRTAVEKYKKNKNIEFKCGNILHLSDIEDETYDRVIVQCVIHHLAGERFHVTRKNTIRAINECMRILKPYGKLLIVESTVTPWFEKFERRLYGLMQLLFRIIRFDAVYQYSEQSLTTLIRSQGLKITSVKTIEIGKYMWLLKHKVPNKLTPCRAVWICVEKELSK